MYDGPMTAAWQRRLKSGGTLVLDGGTGTELRRRGMNLGETTWSALASLTHYELLRAIHVDYIAAGADVITTNTFATTRFVLAAAGRGDDFTAVNTRAVAAAREAREASGRDVAIAGSISCLPPRFDAHAYPNEGAESGAYFELAETLAEAGVDLLLLEMMQETRHAPVACAAARAVGLPVWLGVSCRRGAANVLVGFDFPLVPLATCLDTLLPLGAAAVNVMHSPVEDTGAALRAIAARWWGPFGAYPEIAESGELAPTAFAAHAREWLAIGAQIVGGCCGTTPQHIRELAALRATMEAEGSR